MKTYSVHVERDGRFWLIQVPEIGRSTQARHLREVDEMTRDLIAIMLDVEPDSFELDTELVLAETVRTHLAAAAHHRATAATSNRAAALETRAAARELADAGLTVRDIGAALHVSHQRAHQLLQQDLQTTG